MTDKTCQNCIFYDNKASLCHRYPRIARQVFAPIKKILDMLSFDYSTTWRGTVSSFVPHYPTDWCGEFKNKSEGL